MQVKKETWEALNKEWVEKEELKKQQQAEAEKVRNLVVSEPGMVAARRGVDRWSA